MNDLFNISELYIYPIKGLSGVKVNDALVTERGLKNDRRWMLVDEKKQFISQRTFPQLCLFKIILEPNSFRVTFNELSIEIPFELLHGEIISVKIWNDTVEAIVANESINSYFSKHLQIKCSLIYMPDTTHRLVDKNFVDHDYSVNFSDGYPILIIGESSINLLNQKLKMPININRFRPNIVFTGGIAHIEDEWQNFMINDVKLKGVKPCARCTVTTINQENANISKEPLKSLATYRNFNNKINFGQNVIVLKEGKVKVGDKIKLL